MRVVAIIPARGGSKGTPRKNVTVVGKTTLIGRSVEAAKASTFVEAVFVSTDDAEIANVAAAHGATVIMRPPELARDESMSEEAILHVLSVIEPPDIVVFLQCTSPFTSGKDIDGAVQLFLDQNADSLVSVTHTHGFLWRKGPHGFAQPVNHNKAIRPRRQDLEPQYQENGAIYVMDTQMFLKIKHRFFGFTALYEMPYDKALEIDTPWDMFLAQMLVNHVR